MRFIITGCHQVSTLYKFMHNIKSTYLSLDNTHTHTHTHTHVCLCINVGLLHVLLGEWITPTVTGDRPPPIHSFTLTSFTNNIAVLFGGNTANGSSNNVYIINFTKTSVVSVLQ